MYIPQIFDSSSNSQKELWKRSESTQLPYIRVHPRKYQL